MKQAILSGLTYFNFLVELIKRDFKKKYYKSVLGVIWTILKPLMMMTVLSIIFSTIFNRSIAHYPIYYLSGWVVFNFVIEATTQGLHSVVSNSALIKKIYVPSYLFCVSDVVLSMISKLFSLIPLFLAILVLKAPIHWTISLIPLVLIPLFFFAMGVSLALAAMGVYFRDLFHLYGIVTMVWMYLTPLFYPFSIIPDRLKFFWNYNPMFHYVNIMRCLVLYGTLPDAATVVYAISYSVLAMAIGVTVYSKLADNFFLHF